MNRILYLLTLVQTFLSLRVISRFMRGAGGEPIRPEDARREDDERVAVIVPVLNEAQRLSPCLESLMKQGPAVSEIIVVDGGSNDGTQALILSYSWKDDRIRLVDASPVPANWNGKAWGLQVGLQSVYTNPVWVLTVDADVRLEVPVVEAMLGRANREKLPALSVATLQEIEGVGESLLHPSLLTTLVYRFGVPNRRYQRVDEVQANGQCFLCDRDVLESVSGFEPARTSLCEDVTIARELISNGYPVGFYEAGSLAHVKMYENWREMWFNWPRSLMMHDRFSGWSTLLGWLEIFFVQALPLPLLMCVGCNELYPYIKWGMKRSKAKKGWRKGDDRKGRNKLVSYIAMALNAFLIAARVGVLFGTEQSYKKSSWSYWLSPLCDMPVVLWLGKMVLQRRHTWRGREMVRDDA